MLKIAALVGLVLISIPSPDLAWADQRPQPVVVAGNDSGIRTTVTASGHGGTTTVSAPSVGGDPGVHCTYNFPGDEGQLFREDRNGVSGRYYFVDCYRGSQLVSRQLTWFPDVAPPLGAPVVVTPAELARQAVDQLRLPTPQPRHSPNRMNGRPETVVGIDTWWWVDAASYRPITHTVRAGPVWARVTARPVSTFWQSGSADAEDVRCDGPGTAYDTSRSADQQHSDCVTVYGRSSASQPQTGPDPNDRYFTAAVTVSWQVSWVGTGGAAGAMPPLTRTSRFPIAVAEVQTVNK